MHWPIRMAGRLDEMSEGKISLGVKIQPDGDITLSIDYDGMPIEDEKGNKAKVEFCATSGGGGTSPCTRAALIDLFTAMIRDNRADPSGISPFPLGLAECMEKEHG